MTYQVQSIIQTSSIEFKNLEKHPDHFDSLVRLFQEAVKHPIEEGESSIQDKINQNKSRYEIVLIREMPAGIIIWEQKQNDKDLTISELKFINASNHLKTDVIQALVIKFFNFAQKQNIDQISFVIDPHQASFCSLLERDYCDLKLEKEPFTYTVPRDRSDRLRLSRTTQMTSTFNPTKPVENARASTASRYTERRERDSTIRRETPARQRPGSRTSAETMRQVPSFTQSDVTLGTSRNKRSQTCSRRQHELNDHRDKIHKGSVDQVK